MPKVELLTLGGAHLRWIPGRLAKAMVEAGAAEIHNANGKVKVVRLIAAASSHARRIGEPTPGWKSSPFIVREKLECGMTVWRFHPRSFDR
jgi:hypothetical protein